MSRIPVPVRYRVDRPGPRHVRQPQTQAAGDGLEHLQPALVPGRSRRFSERHEQEPGAPGQGPYDYARAVRVFPESKSATVHFKVHAAQNQAGRLEIEVTDRFGYRPVRLIFADDGQIKVVNGCRAHNSGAVSCRTNGTKSALKVDVANGRFDVSLDGNRPSSGAVSPNTSRMSNGFRSARARSAESRPSSRRPIEVPTLSRQIPTWPNRSPCFTSTTCKSCRKKIRAPRRPLRVRGNKQKSRWVARTARPPVFFDV